MSKTSQNLSHQTSGIGRFMVAAGAIIETEETGQILLIRRAEGVDFQGGEWEIVYGRVDQYEDLPTALVREVREETSLKVTVGSVVNVWHDFRGKKSIENEMIGVTYHCQVSLDQQAQVKLSQEHTEHRWVSLTEALNLVVNPGIKRDLEQFLEFLQVRADQNKSLERERQALADYQNLIRRTQENHSNQARLASRDFVSLLIQPLQHLSLVTDQLNDQGLNMVYAEFWQALANQGLEEINPINQQFDVETMEAVETAGKGSKVVKVVTPGYRLNGEVIQHAKVVVG